MVNTFKLKTEKKKWCKWREISYTVRIGLRNYKINYSYTFSRKRL